jgi:hypothetical protein
MRRTAGLAFQRVVAHQGDSQPQTVGLTLVDRAFVIRASRRHQMVVASALRLRRSLVSESRRARSPSSE